MPRQCRPQIPVPVVQTESLALNRWAVLRSIGRIEDGAVGDSTGFVKVQAIHTSESLHGFQLLHQRVLTCQTNGCEREIQRGEQHQAFRDHTDHTGHCGNDRGTPFAGRNGHIPAANSAYLRPDEQYAERHHQEGHEFQNRVDALV